MSNLVSSDIQQKIWLVQKLTKILNQLMINVKEKMQNTHYQIIIIILNCSSFLQLKQLSKFNQIA